MKTFRHDPYMIGFWNWENLSWWQRVKIFFWQRGKIWPSCSYVRCRILKDILGKSIVHRFFQCQCSKGDKRTCACWCKDGVLEFSYNGRIKYSNATGKKK